MGVAFCGKPETCPRLAAATGSGDISVKISPTGLFNSSSITLMAMDVGNEGRRSCRLDRVCRTWPPSGSESNNLLLEQIYNLMARSSCRAVCGMEDAMVVFSLRPVSRLPKCRALQISHLLPKQGMLCVTKSSLLGAEICQMPPLNKLVGGGLAARTRLAQL